MPHFDPIPHLRKRLKEAGPTSWPGIARKTGLTESFLRKLAYGDRDNPRLNSILPLIRHFERVDARAGRAHRRT